MDNDGIDEMVFVYAKGVFNDIDSEISPEGKLYIYTLNNGNIQKLYESEQYQISSSESGMRVGKSDVNDINYIILKEYVFGGGCSIDYQILSKEKNSINIVKFHSSDDLYSKEIKYTINDTNVTENKFFSEISKYTGLGTLSNISYDKQDSYFAKIIFNRLNDYSIIDSLKYVKEISVILNGQKLSFDQSPYIENGTTRVPMRKIFESLGATVEYDSNTKTITVRKGSNIIELATGSSTAKINGREMTLTTSVENKNGITMVPLRFVSEALGADVNWDADTRTITIDYYELSDEEKLSSAKQMFANFFKGNQEFLFKDEQLLYKLMYKEFYVDNVSGHIVDKFAEYVTDNEVDEDKYIEILSTLLTLSDMEFSSAIYNQTEYDSNKTVEDYAFDIFDIISGSVSPEASSKSYIVQQVLNGGKEVVGIVSDASDKAKIINNIGQSTQRKMEILDAIYNNTDDEQLKSAIIKTKDGLSNTTLAELDIVAKSSEDLSKYIGNEILFKEMMFPLLKETDIYKSDETVKFFVNGSSEVFDAAKAGLGAFTTGAKLGLFAGDMILGTTDTVNDVTSIKAVYEISQSMEAYLVNETQKINSMNLDEMKMLVSKYNFLTYIHLKGEYISYNLVTKDQKLFSLLLKDKKETIDKYMDIHIQWLTQINETLNNVIFM